MVNVEPHEIKEKLEKKTVKKSARRGNGILSHASNTFSGLSPHFHLFFNKKE